MLSDGSELGFGKQVGSTLSCGTCPAGQGMAFRYIRSMDEPTSDHHGWPAGDVGFFKGLGVGTDGTEYHKYLSLSSGTPPSLCWYDDAYPRPYGFVGEPLSGNRIALYARNIGAANVGLRAHVIHEEVVIHGQAINAFPICLDCSLVPIPIIGGDPFF